MSTFDTPEPPVATRDTDLPDATGGPDENAAVPPSATIRLGRALTIGVVTVAITAALVTQAEMVLSSVRIGYLQLPPVALGMLLFLLALRRAARRITKRMSISDAEMLIVYVMALVGAMVSSHGVAEKLVPLLVIPNYFADSGNNWSNLFGPHTPPALVPYNPHGGAQQDVAATYYERLPRGAEIPWHAWVTPLLTWGVLIVLVLAAFLCLASLLRRSWVDEEKLSFPLARIPIELVTGDGGTLYQSRAFWMGLLLPVVVYAVNGLHQNVPTVPQIPLTFLLNDFVSSPPWNQVYYTPLLISFAAVGFFYLLPQDILCSIWVFFVLSRLEQVGAVSVNIDPASVASSLKFQAVGAYAVLVFTLFASSRHYWIRLWHSLKRRELAPVDNELIPTRYAVIGLAGSIVLSAVWLWVMGMSLWLAVFELLICIFVIAVVMARSTAEAGLLMTETTFRPIDIYSLFAPVHMLGAANLTILSFFDSMFLRDQRGLLLTGFLDGMRVMDAPSIPRRKILPAFALAVGVALVTAVGLNIVLPYHIGALNMDKWMEQGSSRWVFTDDAVFMGSMSAPSPGWATHGSVLAGVVVTSALVALRGMCYWWPLHPLGYVLVGSWSTTQFWFPCLLAWVCKSLSVRYGGAKAIRVATPFFLGMVAGEFGMAVLYVLLNICFHIQAPPFPWS